MQTNPKPKKSLGQHWLHDDAALEAICRAAEVTKTDTVLEIGPGTGTLTRKLVKRAGKVIAVEMDEALVSELQNTFAHELIAKNLQLESGDILGFDLTGLPAGYKVVANIPYYLTSNLIRVLSETPNRASSVVILVQKEVARRVAAQPGGMSLLSVSAQFYWQVSLGRVVEARLFTPPPKVDSQILVMDRREGPLFPDVEPKKFFLLVKAGFAARRKTLANSLAGGLRTEKQQIQEILNQAGLLPTLRAQALTLENWHELYEVCTANGAI